MKVMIYFVMICPNGTFLSCNCAFPAGERVAGGMRFTALITGRVRGQAATVLGTAVLKPGPWTHDLI